jgi:hypothetical protein
MVSERLCGVHVATGRRGALHEESVLSGWSSQHTRGPAML